MNTILAICAILCGIVGIIGAILPIIPGTVLSFVGMLCAYFTSTSALGEGQLWLWGAISVVVIILDYILPAYFSKVFGGSKAGSWGATIGVIVGLFTMGPLGVIVGPFIGAIAGEMLHQKQPFDKAIVVGLGSLVSFFVGTGLKLIVGGFMMYYIWMDVIMLIKQMW